MSGTPNRHCAVCGAPVPAPFHLPDSEISPDLDMRPGEPARSTLRDWIATCPSCHAAAPDLAELPPGARVVVESDAYHALLGIASEETLPFVRWAAICRGTGNVGAAAEALLQAAWAADDAAAMSDAARLRKEVAALWDQPADDATALRLIDVLRRAGEFAAAAARAEALDGKTLDDDVRHTVAFQRARIAGRDVGRHLTTSALPKPATKS